MATTESRSLRRRGRRPAAGLDTAARPTTKREQEADGTRKWRWPRRRREAEAAETTAAERRVADALTGASTTIETARRWRDSLCELDGIHSATARGGQVGGAPSYEGWAATKAERAGGGGDGGAQRVSPWLDRNGGSAGGVGRSGAAIGAARVT
jgi:hypothetical protein